MHKHTQTKPAQKPHLQDSDTDMDTCIICIYTSAHTHTKPAQRRLSRARISRLQHSDIYICDMCFIHVICVYRHACTNTLHYIRSAIPFWRTQTPSTGFEYKRRRGGALLRRRGARGRRGGPLLRCRGAWCMRYRTYLYIFIYIWRIHAPYVTSSIFKSCRPRLTQTRSAGFEYWWSYIRRMYHAPTHIRTTYTIIEYVCRTGWLRLVGSLQIIGLFCRISSLL